jgi:hypothetical protein
MIEIWIRKEFVFRNPEGGQPRFGAFQGWNGRDVSVFTNGYGERYTDHGTMARKDAEALIRRWCVRGEVPQPHDRREQPC